MVEDHDCREGLTTIILVVVVSMAVPTPVSALLPMVAVTINMIMVMLIRPSMTPYQLQDAAGRKLALAAAHRELQLRREIHGRRH